MNISTTAMCRIVTICALTICITSIAGGVVFTLTTLELTTSGSNISWIIYLITTQTIWRVPIEFYIAPVAVILLTARRSIHWSMLLCTTLLAMTLGMIGRNPRDVLLWIMILSSAIGIYTLNSCFNGTLKTFVQGFTNDVRYIRQKSASAWRLVVVILAGALFINYLHGEIIRHASEEARNERLLAQYKNNRAKTAESSVTVLEIFTDYQCPACGKLAIKYQEMAAATGSENILVKFRDYPLDSACNDLNPSSGTLPHPVACSAAYSVRLANQEVPDKVHDLRTWLYANQAKFDDRAIMQKLEEIGVGDPQDMFDPKIKHAVQTDLQDAKNYGISGVPSIVLNGVLLPPGLNPTALGMLLEFEIGGTNGNVQ